MSYYKGKNGVPALGDLLGQIDIIIDGLGADPAALNFSRFSWANFGPAGNEQLQKQNRATYRSEFSKLRRDIERQASIYANLSNEACFDCSVAETWFILKAVAYTLAESYQYEKSFNVGLNQNQGANMTLDATGELDPTKSDPKATDKDSTAYAKWRSVGSSTFDGSRGVQKVELDKVSDQWVAALDPDFMAKLKKKICAMIGSKEHPYSKHETFFRFAKEIQQQVNDGFYITDRDSTTAFQKAFAAERSWGTSYAKRPMATVAGILAGKPDQCAKSELYAEDIKGLITELPKWCPSE